MPSSAASTALPFPTLAAVNGAALGGGLELALHCDARTLASNVRHLGFPEVFLGLFPAWGGTQLLPRLVGAEAAVELIVDNPLRQNRLTRADRRSPSASSTTCSSPSSSSTSRSSFSSGRSSPVRPPGPTPTSPTSRTSCARRARGSTTRSTARRPPPTGRSS